MPLDEICTVKCGCANNEPAFIAVGLLRADDVAWSIVVVRLFLAPTNTTKMGEEKDKPTVPSSLFFKIMDGDGASCLLPHPM